MMFFRITEEKLKRWEEKEEIEKLITYGLGHKKKGIREAASGILLKMGEPIVEPLVKAIRNRKVYPRIEAARILGIIGDKRSIEPLISALGSWNKDVEKEAYEALIGFREPIALIEPLVDALRNDNERIEINARLILSRIRKPGFEEALIKALFSRGHEGILRNAVWICESIGSQKAIEPLTSLLRIDFLDGRIRDYAFSALNKLGWKPTDDENLARYYINKEEFEKCIKLGSKAVGPLIEALDLNRIRIQVIKALGEIRDKRAVKPLIPYTRPGYFPDERISAIKVLGLIGDPIAVDALIKNLANDDDHLNVRIESARALGRIGDMSAAVALSRLAMTNDPNDLIGQVASEAYEKILERNRKT